MATVRERREKGDIGTSSSVMTVRQKRMGRENKQYADAMKGSRLQEIETTNKSKVEDKKKQDAFNETIYGGTNKFLAPENKQNIKESVKTYETLDSAKKRLLSKGPVGDELVERPSYGQRVKERIAEFPTAVQPLIAPIAALDQAPFMLSTREALGSQDSARDGFLPVSGGGKIAGQILAPLHHIAGAQGAGLAGGQLYSEAGNLLSRYAPNLANTVGGRIASKVIQGVSEGIPTNVGGTLAANPQATPQELQEAALYGGAFGLLPGIGKGAVELSDFGKRVLSERLLQITGNQADAIRATVTPESPLMLGEPRMRGNANRAESPDVIYGQGKVKTNEPLALPVPQLDNPTTARVERRTNVYAQKYEDLIAEARRRGLDKQPFVNGRTLESELDSLWSQMAGPEDPGLDDLIVLAHPEKASKLSPDLLQRARAAQDRREAYGVPLKAKKLDERYDGGVTGGAAAPVEKVGRAPLTEPPMPQPQADVVVGSAPERSRIDVTPQEQPMTVRQRREAQQPAPVKQPAPANANPAPTQGRGFAQTLVESEKTPQGFKDQMKSAYTPKSNQETLDIANKRIKKDVEESTSFVMGNSRFTAEKAATAQRLIDIYNGQGNFQRAVDIAQKVSEEATRAGQSIQALSMFNRLTAEGILIHAQRIAKKTNEAIPLGAKEVKVTPGMAASITGLAQTTQKMTGVKDLSNNVIDILERAKSGTKLSDTEAQELKRFVNESKQFIEETARKPRAPRPPQQPKDSRVRDNVVSFLDAQEKAAKERLRARGIRVSSTPLDVWADYAIIGAAKMGKGTIKLADWSEAMVKDLGEEIRPHLQQLYERSREAFEQSAKKVTAQTISEAEKLTEKVIKGKQLAPAEADSLRSLAQKVSRLSGEEKRLASQDLQVILQTLEKPGILKKISTLQTIGQLFNPKTQVRNALGNELFYRLERLNKVIATPIDIARSKITGGERTITFKTNNQGEYWTNWMRGLKAGWKGTNVNGLETQYDLGSPAFKGKYNPATYLEKALGAALKSFDTAAYMRAYNNTIGEQATLRAINEGQRGNKALIEKCIREVDDNVMKLADQYGRYVTFQDNNLISRGLVAFKRGLNLKQDFGFGDLIIKYPKTPGALLMRALEYSPAGAFRSLGIISRPWFKKEPNTAEAIQALTRAIIGTGGLSLAGYFLLDKGILTGSASKDKDIRDLQKSAGQGQYQVNLSALSRWVKSNFATDVKLEKDDFLYTYDWMQPVSIAVSMGANTRKSLTEGNKEGLTGFAKTAYNSIEGGLGTLTEQSVLGGVKRAFEGYPGQTITDKIMDILSDIPASFVPTFSNQLKQLGDNARRETYSDNKLESSLNRAKAKIPGLAEKLPQQYDTLGRPKETYQNPSLLNVMFNPGFSSRYELSPEAKFIVDLINESGDQSLAPRVPSKSITIDGQSIKLNGDMFSRFQQLQGEETRKGISKINPSANLESRIKKTEKGLDSAGEVARKLLKKELNANR